MLLSRLLDEGEEQNNEIRFFLLFNFHLNFISFHTVLISISIAFKVDIGVQTQPDSSQFSFNFKKVNFLGVYFTWKKLKQFITIFESLDSGLTKVNQ